MGAVFLGKSELVRGPQGFRRARSFPGVVRGSLSIFGFIPISERMAFYRIRDALSRPNVLRIE